MAEMYRKRKRDLIEKPRKIFEHFWYWLVKNQNNLPFKIISYLLQVLHRYNYSNMFYFELQFQWETIIVGQGKQVENCIKIGREIFVYNHNNKFKIVKRPVKIPDPIILYPINLESLKEIGFVIVTAWGKESLDKLIFNSKQN